MVRIYINQQREGVVVSNLTLRHNPGFRFYFTGIASSRIIFNKFLLENRIVIE